MTKKDVFLSVIIPVYNEEKTVLTIIKKVVANLPPNSEVVVVNDGSTDSTLQKLKSFKSDTRIRIFNLSKNRGKGYAVRFGLRKAIGDIFLIQDADLEYDPQDYKRLIKPIKQKQAQVVYGSRLMKYPLSLKTLLNIPMPLHFLANKLLSFTTNILYGSKLSDMETCYKAFTRRVYRKIKLTKNGFDIEVEITTKILKAGFEIKEIPIETRPRSYKEGKKISGMDAVYAFLTLLENRIDAYLIPVLAVLGLAAFLRFWNFINRFGLWSDQARDAIVGRVSNQNHTIPLIGSFSSAGPFTFGPYWYWFSMLMDLIFPGYLGYWIGMGIASLVMIAVLMWIGRSIGGRFMGLVTGIFAAISLAQIQSSLGSTQHSMVGVVVAISMAFMLCYLKYGRNLFLFLSGLTLSLSTNLHYQTIYLLPMLLILMLIKRPKFIGWVWVLISLVIPFIPLFIFDLQHEMWNFVRILDYYRFGQYRIYVPNRWLTYAGIFWPTYWAKVVGGFLWFAYPLMAAIGVIFITKLFRRRLTSEILVYGFGFLAAIVWFRYFRGERMEGYIVFSQPLILVLTAWFLTIVWKWKPTIGYFTTFILLVGSIASLAGNLAYRNNYTSIVFLQRELTSVIQTNSYAFYDQEFRTSGCSISLSLLLDDEGRSSIYGTPVGICERNSCPPKYKVIAGAQVGGFYCQLVDLNGVAVNTLERQNWVLVSPDAVQRMTVEWWKDEGI